MTALGQLARRRTSAAFLILTALFACAPFRSSQPDTLPGALTLRVAPVALNLEDTTATRVGKLVWRGGVTLSARHRAFGGWSDLWVAPDGSRMRAVSDDGVWMTAGLHYDASGHLLGVGAARQGRLKSPDDTWLAGKTWGDAESLAMLADGSWLVGFERRHRILRYPAGDEAVGGGFAGRPTPFPTPPELAGAPANKGLEAMTVLPDGRLFLLTEEHRLKPGTTVGWIGTMQGATPVWSRFHYTPVEGFQPTAAATLPDGDIILLERTAGLPGGWRVRVMRLSAAALRPDAVVQAEELARLATPWVTENLEGIAVRRGPGGETLLWLISDDNFSFLQQTVLLHFALAD